MLCAAHIIFNWIPAYAGMTAMRTRITSQNISMLIFIFIKKSHTQLSIRSFTPPSRPYVLG
jgi:hypothetical protein